MCPSSICFNCSFNLCLCFTKQRCRCFCTGIYFCPTWSCSSQLSSFTIQHNKSLFYDILLQVNILEGTVNADGHKSQSAVLKEGSQVTSFIVVLSSAAYTHTHAHTRQLFTADSTVQKCMSHEFKLRHSRCFCSFLVCFDAMTDLSLLRTYLLLFA